MALVNCADCKRSIGEDVRICPYCGAINSPYSVGRRPGRGQATGPIDAFQMSMSKYADFSGRSTRSEYWYLSLFYVLMGILWFMLFVFMPTIMTIVGIIALVATIIPNFAVTVRRLHDTDRSGWWIFVGLIPIVGGLVLFIFEILPGTYGRNRFGPDPLNPDATASRFY